MWITAWLEYAAVPGFHSAGCMARADVQSGPGCGEFPIRDSGTYEDISRVQLAEDRCFSRKIYLVQFVFMLINSFSGMLLEACVVCIVGYTINSNPLQ